MFRRACLAAFVFAALLTPTVVQQRHVESASHPVPAQTTGKIIVRFLPNASLSTVGNAFEAARTEVVASTAGRSCGAMRTSRSGAGSSTS